MFDIISELEEYAGIEGSELGETCLCLIRLWEMHPYLSNELQELVAEEIRWHLDNFKNNYVLKSKTRTIKQTYKHLEFLEGLE